MKETTVYSNFTEIVLAYDQGDLVEGSEVWVFTDDKEVIVGKGRVVLDKETQEIKVEFDN